MKIAILTWGPLVLDPREPQTAPKFVADGPLLPIEFCRILSDGRLTLAIDEAFGAICRTYSAPSAVDSLDASIENLRLREEMGRSSAAVGFVEFASGRQSDVAMEGHPEAVATISAWAASKGYDAAIWNALASNFNELDKGGEPFSVSAAVQYLETLEADDPAKFAEALAYIREAPPEVDTPVRERVAIRWP